MVESVRGQAGGETMQTHMTMDDQRWMEHGKMYSSSLSGRGKKEKEMYKLCTLSIFSL